MTGEARSPVRNPHAGEPFTDDDATIEAMLQDVSVPALLCSLVHMTGDPGWVRGPWRLGARSLVDFQSAMSAEDRSDVVRRAVPAVAAYRDGGCQPYELDADLVVEMMTFLAGQPLDEATGAMFVEDLHLDGADSGAITWGDEVTDEVAVANDVVVVGCGMSGIVAGIRLAQAGLPFTIVEKAKGPGGTWWDNRYPGARVDVGSHSYCYSFEPAHHWSEYFCQQPELAAYFGGVLDQHDLRTRCRFETEVVALDWDAQAERWAVTVRTADGVEEVLRPRFVISSVGSLNLPRMPKIPGMDSFTGRSFHSARWPDDVDITGTRFALIGAGATELPDRTDDCGSGRPTDDPSANRAVDVPQPLLPLAGAAGRVVGDAAPAFLWPMVPVRHDLPRLRIGGGGVSAGPELRRPVGPGHQREQRCAQGPVDRVDYLQPRGPAGFDRQVRAAVPEFRKANAAGQRFVVHVLEEAERRIGPYRHRTNRARRAGRPTASSTRPT